MQDPYCQVTNNQCLAHPYPHAKAFAESQHHWQRPFDLVLQGGGVRGIALVGALSVLQEQGFTMQRAVGSSAGAIVGSLYAAGYTGKELHKIIHDFNFSGLRDHNWIDRVPLVGRVISLLASNGLFEGDALYEWLEGLFSAKGIYTFSDLKHPLSEFEPQLTSRYRMQVIVSDITTRELLVLPRDAHKLGVEPDALSVPLAVRMSASIPVFFEPVCFTNPKTGIEHILVDGAMLSNFPVWFFDNKHPRWPTFGVMLSDEDLNISPDSPNQASQEYEEGVFFEQAAKPQTKQTRRARHMGLVGYLKSLVLTMLEAHDRLHLERSSLERTIVVPVKGIKLTQFNLSEEQIELLYCSGRQAAETFLAKWRAETYVNTYGLPTPFFPPLPAGSPPTAYPFVPASAYALPAPSPSSSYLPTYLGSKSLQS